MLIKKLLLMKLIGLKMQTNRLKRRSNQPTIDCLYRYCHSIHPPREDCKVCMKDEVEMMGCPYFKKVEIYETGERK